jgi:cephalosporin hydroxylase
MALVSLKNQFAHAKIDILSQPSVRHECKTLKQVDSVINYPSEKLDLRFMPFPLLLKLKISRYDLVVVVLNNEYGMNYENVFWFAWAISPKSIIKFDPFNGIWARESENLKKWLPVKWRKKLNPPIQPYRRLFQMSLSDWLIHIFKSNIVFSSSWMGIRMIKNPLDAWIYQEILWELKPDIVLEIGSFEGGSTLYFAHLLDAIGCGQVISVDIDRSNFKAKHERIVEVTGDSSAPETVAKVRELCQGKKVFAIHDADHTRDKVLADLRAYKDLVSVGSYFIVEDGFTDLFTFGDGIGMPFPGPLKAVEIFVKETPEFIIDRARERYILTFCPRGYLKKIK